MSVLYTNRHEVCFVHIQSTLLAANSLHDITWWIIYGVLTGRLVANERYFMYLGCG